MPKILVVFCIQCPTGMLMQEHRIKREKPFMTSQGQGPRELLRDLGSPTFVILFIL